MMTYDFSFFKKKPLLHYLTAVIQPMDAFPWAKMEIGSDSFIVKGQNVTSLKYLILWATKQTC